MSEIDLACHGCGRKSLNIDKIINSTDHYCEFCGSNTGVINYDWYRLPGEGRHKWHSNCQNCCHRTVRSAS